jgi:hypothetical protein
VIETSPGEPTGAPPRRDGGYIEAVFVAIGVVAGVALAYLGSAVAFAGEAVFFDASDTSAINLSFRFNGILTLVIAFTAAVLVAERRAIARDLAELRAVVEASDSEWAAWQRRPSEPRGRRLAAVSGLGGALGVAISVTGMVVASEPRAGDPWIGHTIWDLVLNAALFALLAVLAQRSVGRARVLSEMGRRVRVRLIDPSDLSPFARAGLRGAIYWFLGSSIASLLAIDADVPWLVAIVIAVTVGLGIWSLRLPSRGVHESLRHAKRAELERVRSEIERTRDALLRPDDADCERTARLPALLAYEARVSSVREWPFDSVTLARFLVVLLVPLGSWLGGALVERLVDFVLD